MRLHVARIRSIGKRFSLPLLILGGAGMLAAGIAEHLITAAAAGHIHGSLEEIRPADVALVLGANPRVQGVPNPFYEARLDAATRLFNARVVRGILVSGDNSRSDYDEPSHMKADLIRRGIPAEFITCDFAGFSTLDSVRRARPVFGQQKVILVSQRFHLERALYLAGASGLTAEGFAAEDAPLQWHLRVRSRETLARVKAVFDVALGRGPRFLGPRERVNLGADSPLR